jgi:hypothetical protein
MMTASETRLEIPFPDAAGHHLSFSLNGVHLKLGPGEGPLWVEGLATYKRPPAPNVQQAGGEVSIHQEFTRSELTNMFRIASDSPVLDLTLGRERSYQLTIEDMADQLDLDLGGLPLQKVRVNLPLGKCYLDFSAPHPYMMQELLLEVQGSKLEVKHLGRAHCQEMIVKGISSACQLHWGEDLGLKAEMRLELQTKNTPAVLTLPAQIAIRLEALSGHFDPESAEFKLHPDFKAEGEAYLNRAARQNQGPLLRILAAPSSPISINLID